MMRHGGIGFIEGSKCATGRDMAVNHGSHKEGQKDHSGCHEQTPGNRKDFIASGRSQLTFLMKTLYRSVWLLPLRISALLAEKFPVLLMRL